MRTAIVGLGLIGGSIAKALRGFENTEIIGIDTSCSVLERAKKEKVIDLGDTGGELIGTCDLIILALYPESNVNFIKKYGSLFKKGCVLTDVSGVKQYLYRSLDGVLPPGVDFIGGHPMAGKEKGGYENSDSKLFSGASFIITPNEANKPENVELVRKMARYIGCTRIVEATPQRHDRMIAYTSQLMHVVAVALCDSPLISGAAVFSAGSLRDCTRVADINADMWSELFLENKNELLQCIDEFSESLGKISSALKTENREELREFMSAAAQKKNKWLKN